MRIRLHVVCLLLSVQSVAVPAIATAAKGTTDTCRTVDEVLERFVEALSGPDAIEKLTTRVCRGTLTMDLSSRMPPIYEVTPVEIYAKTPDRLLILHHKSAGVERSGFDGEVGWTQNADELRSDEEVGKSKLAWLLNPQNALNVRKYFPGLILKPCERIEGSTVYVLEPTGIPKEHYTLYFDIETGMLIRIGYYWDLRDYRIIDGVWFPFRISMSRKGGSSTYVFDTVEHNLPINDTLFTMPQATEK